MAEPILNPLPTAALVTARHDIDGFAIDGKAIFSVNAGIPLSAAFDQLSILLATAHSVIESAAMSESSGAEPASSWAPAHLLHFAYGLTQAMHDGFRKGDSHE